jgi:hypothetical protein
MSSNLYALQASEIQASMSRIDPKIDIRGQHINC